jgi:hypothetical protein
MTMMIMMFDQVSVPYRLSILCYMHFIFILGIIIRQLFLSSSFFHLRLLRMSPPHCALSNLSLYGLPCSPVISWFAVGMNQLR